MITSFLNTCASAVSFAHHVYTLTVATDEAVWDALALKQQAQVDCTAMTRQDSKMDDDGPMKPVHLLEQENAVLKRQLAQHKKKLRETREAQVATKQELCIKDRVWQYMAPRYQQCMKQLVTQLWGCEQELASHRARHERTIAACFLVINSLEMQLANARAGRQVLVEMVSDAENQLAAERNRNAQHDVAMGNVVANCSALRSEKRALEAKIESLRTDMHRQCVFGEMRYKLEALNRRQNKYDMEQQMAKVVVALADLTNDRDRWRTLAIKNIELVQAYKVDGQDLRRMLDSQDEELARQEEQVMKFMAEAERLHSAMGSQRTYVSLLKRTSSAPRLMR